MIMSDEQFAVVAAKDAEIERLRARCEELNEACAAKQVLIDHTASDLRDMRDLYEREKAELRAELSQADFDRKAWKAECFRIEALLREARALAQPAATGEGALKEALNGLVFCEECTMRLARALNAALAQPAATGEGAP